MSRISFACRICKVLQPKSELLNVSCKTFSTANQTRVIEDRLQARIIAAGLLFVNSQL